MKNDENAYSFNNITTKKDDDGSVTIQFGGCGGKTPYCCRSCPAGTTRCASIVRAKRFSMALGSFRKRSRNDIFPKRKQFIKNL